MRLRPVLLTRLAHAALTVACAAPAVARGQAANLARDSLAQQVDRVFAEYATPDSPGCALGVYHNGRMRYARGYGRANLELGAAITPKTVFDIGSTSKQFTAMSILLLARQGKLSLDDDVRKHLPELPAYAQPVTIRHLLHHTSGIRDYLTIMTLGGERTENWTTDDDALAVITRQRALNFPPGTEWLYSNSGYFLLSVIVKRASGQSLRQFAQANIFAPLGMTSTHFHDDHGMIVRNRAAGYSPVDSADSSSAESGSAGMGSTIARPRFRIEMSDFEQTGDGSVFTTVEDLLRWDENFYTATVGGADIIAQMTTPGKLSSGEALEYALGLFDGEYRGLRTVSHGGSWAGYQAELLRFPGEHFSVACLCNLSSADPEQLARAVADIYLADRLAPSDSAAASTDTGTVATLSPAQLQALVGTYHDSATREVTRLSLVEGELRLDAFGLSLELRPRSATEFHSVHAPVAARLVFEPARTGGPRRFRLSAEGIRETTYEETPVVAPSAAVLREYAGTYSSEEVNATYRLAVEEGTLVLHAKSLPPEPLRPTLQDEFEYAPYDLGLRFTRGVGRRVTGFLLNAGRTRDLRFERIR